MENEKVIQITTKEGQRWCDISFTAYGKATLMNEIISANPTVPIYDRFPDGVVLNVPIKDTVDIVTDAELLPPWKQNL